MTIFDFNVYEIICVKIKKGDLKPENVLMRGDASDSRGFICKVQFNT